VGEAGGGGGFLHFSVHCIDLQVDGAVDPALFDFSARSGLGV